jgi:hypothetical protein
VLSIPGSNRRSDAFQPGGFNTTGKSCLRRQSNDEMSCAGMAQKHVHEFAVMHFPITHRSLRRSCQLQGRLGGVKGTSWAMASAYGRCGVCSFRAEQNLPKTTFSN